MVIVKLMGGLGNQMFQYAVARRLAHVNKAPLKLDLSWFENIPHGDTCRKYELHVFECLQDVATPEEVKALRGADIGKWPKVAKSFLKSIGLFTNPAYIKEKFFHFDPELLGLSGDIYLDGFWQSAKYFEDVEEIIRADFTIRLAQDPLNNELGDTIQSCESVSIHVRRGDYINDEKTGCFHGITSMDYYNAAITEVTSRLHNPHFFVFSDDSSWAKSNLTVDVPMTCLTHNGPENGYEDLRLMSLCKHHIIANSSFSWWGAWLANNHTKMVFAPKRWFHNPGVNTDDLIPGNWIRL